MECEWWNEVLINMRSSKNDWEIIVSLRTLPLPTNNLVNLWSFSVSCPSDHVDSCHLFVGFNSRQRTSSAPQGGLEILKRITSWRGLRVLKVHALEWVYCKIVKKLLLLHSQKTRDKNNLLHSLRCRILVDNFSTSTLLLLVCLLLPLVSLPSITIASSTSRSVVNT